MKKIKPRKEVKKQNKEIFGSILIILAAIISGVSIVVNKFFIVSIDPLVFTSLRLFFIGWIFMIISLFACKFKIKKFNKVSWAYLFIIGVIGGGLAFVFFFTGLKTTTAGSAAFIQKTLPIYATIIAFFFLNEKVTKKQLAAILFMLIGLYFIEYSKISPDAKIGDALVLCATVLWAIENSIAKKVMLNKESNWVVTFSRMFFGSLVILSFVILTGKMDLLFSLNSQQLSYIIVSSLLLLFYVLFWYMGLRYINLSKASSILLVAPIISLILGFMWLGEQVSNIQLLGSLLILIGAFVIIRIKSEKRLEEV